MVEPAEPGDLDLVAVLVRLGGVVILAATLGGVPAAAAVGAPPDAHVAGRMLGHHLRHPTRLEAS